jgi:magnesium transporter
MLKKLYISNGRLVEAEDDKIQPLVYVYIEPAEVEKKELVEKYKIDEHTLNSALDPDELSRLEFEHYGSEDEFLFKVASTGAFMFSDRLIIVMNEDVPLFEGKAFLKVQTTQDIILRIVYRSVSHFLEHLRGMNMLAASIEHLINTAMENKYLLNLFTLEKSLVYYVNATNSNAGLIERMRHNAAKMGFTTENLEFLDDLAIENSQCREQAQTYSHVLAGLMDARASIVSNNLNIRIKALTIITIVIMLPTLVVSIFSMNVKLPIEQHENLESFWIISGIAALTAVIVGLLWWRKRW